MDKYDEKLKEGIKQALRERDAEIAKREFKWLIIEIIAGLIILLTVFPFVLNYIMPTSNKNKQFINANKKESELNLGNIRNYDFTKKEREQVKKAFEEKETELKIKTNSDPLNIDRNQRKGIHSSEIGLPKFNQQTQCKPAKIDGVWQQHCE